MSLVQEALLNWKNYRMGVISEVENIPEEHLGHRSGEGSRSILEIVMHIIQSGVGFTDELLSPTGSFMNLNTPVNLARLERQLPRAANKAGLLNMLRTSGEDNQKRIAEAGEGLVTQTMVGRAGPQSRLSSLWFCIAHEGYHRGQLAICAREIGRTPALTQFIESQAKAPQKT